MHAAHPDWCRYTTCAAVSCCRVSSIRTFTFPQLRIIGGLGCGLLDWLNRYALPEEVRMGEPDYAGAVAGEFVNALASHGTTTALVFGSHFHDATAMLFEAAARQGDAHRQRAGAVRPPAAGAAAQHRRRALTRRAGR